MVNKLTPIFASLKSHLAQITWPDFTPGEIRTIAVLAALAALFMLEARFAHRRHPPRMVRQSYETNLGVFILNDTLMSILSVSSLWLLADRHAETGLLSGLAQPWVKAILSFLLFDLTLYLWHRANHSFDALWMFHKVHHSDRCMNVSTAFRLHGAEVLLTTLVKAAFIVTLGIDSDVLLLNEAVVTIFVMIHHANLAFPAERLLGRLVIVPRLHRVHHSAKRAEHDRNYGAVFSFWDRLFGSFVELEPATLGLSYVPSQSFVALFKYGLTRAVAPGARALRAQIEEAAYFRAERRGFAPGFDLLDWLEAEQEILDLPRRPAAGCSLASRLIPRWCFGHEPGASACLN